ncbi:MAG: hypothetical protein ABIO70_12750 [Pseudomonadota bacterium]
MLLPLLLFFACDPLPVVPVPPPEPLGDIPAPAPEVEEDEEEVASTGHNRAPVILGIDVQPSAPKTGDDLVATVETVDADDDYVRVELFWSVNGEELPGRTDTTLSHDHFAKGDQIRLRVEADDRGSTTEGHTSTFVVRNTPPEITNKPGSLRKVEGFAITAADVDDDPLTFRLQGEPAGMTIDGHGVLHYRGSEEEKGGDYQVQVVVEDGSGGSARWGFGLSVQPGSEAEAAAKAAAAEKAKPKGPYIPPKPREEARDEDDVVE